jgi:hypothetical protein
MAADGGEGFFTASLLEGLNNSIYCGGLRPVGIMIVISYAVIKSSSTVLSILINDAQISEDFFS